MMSPIAIASARSAVGRPVAGTGRRSTRYPRPPVVKLIGMCGSVQALARMRGALAYGALRGTITPSSKTENAWEEAFWKRVIVLMLTSKNPTRVYNDVMSWAKPSWAAEAIEIAFQLQCKSLPSPADALRVKGILIQGVTS